MYYRISTNVSRSLSTCKYCNITIVYSSLSVWDRNCDKLDLPETTRHQLDEFVDSVYRKISEADSVYIDDDGNEQCKSLCINTPVV